MSIEELIKDNTAAQREATAVMNKLIATLQGASGEDVKADSKVKDQKTFRANEETQKAKATATKPTGKKAAASEDEEKSDVPDYDEVRKITFAISKREDLGREATIGLLSKYNVAKAQELKPKQYQSYIDDANALLKGEAEEDLA